MAPLIREYDRHMDDMKDKLQRYEVTYQRDFKCQVSKVMFCCSLPIMHRNLTQYFLFVFDDGPDNDVRH